MIKKVKDSSLLPYFPQDNTIFAVVRAWISYVIVSLFVMSLTNDFTLFSIDEEREQVEVHDTQQDEEHQLAGDDIELDKIEEYKTELTPFQCLTFEFKTKPQFMYEKSVISNDSSVISPPPRLC